MRSALALALLVVACNAPDDEPRDAGDGGEGDDAPDSGPDDCPNDACAAGCEATVGAACLLETAALATNVPFEVELDVAGCRSSGCTEELAPVCNVVVTDNRVEVDAVACVHNLGPLLSSCSEDCGGGDGTRCAVDGLPAGDYVLVFGADEAPFTVPGAVPENEGRCTSWP
jgi:hypothetical protein